MYFKRSPKIVSVFIGLLIISGALWSFAPNVRGMIIAVAIAYFSGIVIGMNKDDTGA